MESLTVKVRLTAVKIHYLSTLILYKIIRGIELIHHLVVLNINYEEYSSIFEFGIINTFRF